jgi:glyoxylase-like metal-dependent hydrolase (beta-lactamase superfamily II)
MKNHNKFYHIGERGFPEGKWHDHAPSPQQFMPSYLSSDEFQKKGYHVESVAENFYWVTAGGYDAAFMVSGKGVVVIDAPPTLGENVLAAIESVTDQKVTHVIYSHSHSDHIGAAIMYGDDVKIYAHQLTKEMLERFPDPQIPIPTHTFEKELTLEINGYKLELAYKGENHCPGNIFIYAPKQKVLVKIDIVSPGSVTFMHCDGLTGNIQAWIDAHSQILEYDFDVLISGHITRWGDRQDVLDAKEYWDDMVAFAWEAIDQMSNRPAALSIIQAAPAEHSFVGLENWINSMCNYVIKKMLSKVTSNGQLWQDRLAGVTVNTKYHAYTIVESIRLERNHKGYQQRGTAGQSYVW